MLVALLIPFIDILVKREAFDVCLWVMFGVLRDIIKNMEIYRSTYI